MAMIFMFRNGERRMGTVYRYFPEYMLKKQSQSPRYARHTMAENMEAMRVFQDEVLLSPETIEEVNDFFIASDDETLSLAGVPAR